VVGAKNKKFKTKETRGEKTFFGFLQVFFVVVKGKNIFLFEKYKIDHWSPREGKPGIALLFWIKGHRFSIMCRHS